MLTNDWKKAINVESRYFKNIECVQGAISDKNEITQFYILEDTTENSLISGKGGIEVNVQTYTLKDIINMFSLKVIDFVKIDIEGSEIKFLSEENIKTSGNWQESTSRSSLSPFR